MGKKSVKLAILLIIFGVPVFWYLFLQVFGENKFELAPIRTLSANCSIQPAQVYLSRQPSNIAEENQVSRLLSSIADRAIMIDSSYVSCIADTATYPLYLIDEKQRLRGCYDLTILEVDRLLVEIDLIEEMQ